MIDVQTLASILLIGRLIAIVFIGWVIYRQIWLFRNYTLPPNARFVRRILFVLTVILLISNIIPATVDLLTVTADIQKTPSRGISPVGLTYTVSNMVTSVASAAAVFYLYLQAKRLLAQG